MFDAIYIYVPNAKHIIRIAEGAGDNLTDDDIAEGYVDYIDYDIHALDPGLPEIEGGMIMLTEPFREEYKSTKECIPAVLNMAYENESIEYKEL